MFMDFILLLHVQDIVNVKFQYAVVFTELLLSGKQFRGNDIILQYLQWIKGFGMSQKWKDPCAKIIISS